MIEEWFGVAAQDVIAALLLLPWELLVLIVALVALARTAWSKAR